MDFKLRIVESYLASTLQMFFKIGLMLSPFLSPADNPDSIFSKGTVASCEGIGFILILGSHAIPWYILFLTYYFLKRVKFKQTPQDFAKCEEKFIFAFILVYAIVTSLYPLIKEQINATKHGESGKQVEFIDHLLFDHNRWQMPNIVCSVSLS